MQATKNYFGIELVMYCQSTTHAYWTWCNLAVCQPSMAITGDTSLKPKKHVATWRWYFSNLILHMKTTASPTRRCLSTRARGILGLAAASCTACGFGRAGACGETLGATPDGRGSNPIGATWCGEKIRLLADLKPPPQKKCERNQGESNFKQKMGGSKMENSSFLGYAPQSTIATQEMGHLGWRSKKLWTCGVGTGGLFKNFDLACRFPLKGKLTWIALGWFSTFYTSTRIPTTIFLISVYEPCFFVRIYHHPKPWKSKAVKIIVPNSWMTKLPYLQKSVFGEHIFFKNWFLDFQCQKKTTISWAVPLPSNCDKMKVYRDPRS